MEIFQHLSSLGGAPLIDSSWDEGSFNVYEIFEKDTHNSVYFFLNHFIERCPHPRNDSQEIVCLQSSVPPIYSDVLVDNIVDMFKEIKIDEKLTRSIAQEFNIFRQKQVNEILPN